METETKLNFLAIIMGALIICMFSIIADTLGGALGLLIVLVAPYIAGGE